MDYRKTGCFATVCQGVLKLNQLLQEVKDEIIAVTRFVSLAIELDCLTFLCELIEFDQNLLYGDESADEWKKLIQAQILAAGLIVEFTYGDK